MAMGPGVDSATTVILTISSSVIHFFFWTQVSLIMDIMAYPPPKVKSPILKKVMKSSKSSAMISPVLFNLFAL